MKIISHIDLFYFKMLKKITIFFDFNLFLVFFEILLSVLGKFSHSR